MGPHSDSVRPWVTVICTCYNHEAYIAEALQSVVRQDYPNVDLFVIDNGSTDRSADRIARFVRAHPAVRFMRNATNVGLNRAFNQGLRLTSGRYVIDLSADDVLLPHRISRQVEQFETLSSAYAVVFSNAGFIDERGYQTGYHYVVDAAGRARQSVPSGDVFLNVLAGYFISTPTMMMRRDVLLELGGYDESLAYEDFDFWVRSARHYRYAYLDEVLTLKRRLPDSLSAQVSRRDNQLLESSLVVCRKALARCSKPSEYSALAGRARQFIRKAFYAEQFELALRFGELLGQLNQPGRSGFDPTTRLILTISRWRVPVNGLYRRYRRGFARRQSPAVAPAPAASLTVSVCPPNL